MPREKVDSPAAATRERTRPGRAHWGLVRGLDLRRARLIVHSSLLD